MWHRVYWLAVCLLVCVCVCRQILSLSASKKGSSAAAAASTSATAAPWTPVDVARVRAMSDHLRDALATWFCVSMLRLERVTWYDCTCTRIGTL